MSNPFINFVAPPTDKRLTRVSYPSTPNNSLTSTPPGFDSVHELPSFNNAETVRKVQEKKQRLGSLEETEKDELNFSFTPQNSVCDSPFESFARQHDLPSFCNAEMVDRIHVKRKSLEMFSDEKETVNQFLRDEQNADFQFDPFTPSNSATDSKFDQYAKEVHLPSLRNSETVRQIREKREKLKTNILANVGFPSGRDEQVLIDFLSEDVQPLINANESTLESSDEHKPGGFYDFEKSADFTPFTPQNSVSASIFDHLTNEQDLPSFNSSAMVDRIQTKRRSMQNIAEREMEFCSRVKHLKTVPFTPQNSYTNLGQLAELGKRDKTEPIRFVPDDLVDRVTHKRRMSDLIALENAGSFNSSTDEEVMFAFQAENSQPPAKKSGHESDSSEENNSLRAYSNFMDGVSSSEEGICLLAKTPSQETEELNEDNMVQEFVDGILEAAVDIVSADQSESTPFLGQSEHKGGILEDAVDIVTADQSESTPLLGQSDHKEQTLKKGGLNSLRSTRVRFSVDHEELGSDAILEIIADEIAGDDPDVVPIGGTLCFNPEVENTSQNIFSSNFDDASSDTSSDSDGNVGSYDIGAINRDVVSYVAHDFVDGVIKDAMTRYKEDTMQEVADEFVSKVVQSAVDEYEMSCKEAAEEFAAELIQQVLAEFNPNGQNDASDDTGIFDQSDGVLSPAADKLGKIGSVESEGSNGYRKATPKSLSLDSPLQFMSKCDLPNPDSEPTVVKRLKKNLSEPSPGFGRRGSDLDLETEYLCSVDPLGGNMEIVSSPDRSFATDAVRDIAENTSFKQMRKESGIFDDSDNEDSESLKTFLELRALQQHFANKEHDESRSRKQNNKPKFVRGNSEPFPAPDWKVNDVGRQPYRRELSIDSGVRSESEFAAVRANSWGRGQAWDAGSRGILETDDQICFGRHHGVGGSAVSDADVFEDLSEREDSEVFLDSPQAALLGSQNSSRRSSNKLSASSGRTLSSHGSRTTDDDIMEPITVPEWDRKKSYVHVRRKNGDIVYLKKTLIQEKMAKFGLKMEKPSQKEIFYTTAGRISIQVDSFPEFLEDGTRVIDEDGFVQLLGGRYEISKELLDSADKLCRKVDENKRNQPSLDDPDRVADADDVIKEVAGDTITKVPDVIHETEGTDSEDNNNEKKCERPSTLTTSGSFRKKIRVLNQGEMDFTKERFPSVGEADAKSLDKSMEQDEVQTPDDLQTPDLEALGVSDLDWDDEGESVESTTPEGDSESPIEPIPEYSATEEFQDQRNWRKVTIADKTYKIDMKVIEPYKKVLSHGGYYGDGLNAIIIFASCYLPDKERRDYNYVMDNLFLYVISTLELLVAEDYMIIYFHGSTPRTRMPTISWMRRCYQIIDRRLRKNLKGLLLVHPTFWLKTVVLMTKPFISTKFSSKVKFIHSLKELSETIPMEYVFVPDQVKRYDHLMRKRRQVSSSSTSSPVSPVSSSIDEARQMRRRRRFWQRKKRGEVLDRNVPEVAPPGVAPPGVAQVNPEADLTDIKNLEEKDGAQEKSLEKKIDGENEETAGQEIDLKVIKEFQENSDDSGQETNFQDVTRSENNVKCLDSILECPDESEESVLDAQGEKVDSSAQCEGSSGEKLKDDGVSVEVEKEADCPRKNSTMEFYMWDD